MLWILPKAAKVSSKSSLSFNNSIIYSYFFYKSFNKSSFFSFSANLPTLYISLNSLTTTFFDLTIFLSLFFSFSIYSYSRFRFSPIFNKLLYMLSYYFFKSLAILINSLILVKYFLWLPTAPLSCIKNSA
jgi:hypothetical protein